MARALRKLQNKRHWDREREPGEEWLLGHQARGDALVDLKTVGNALSIYIVEDLSDAAIDRVVTALAANSDHLAAIDYVTFDAALLGGLQLDTAETPGTTLDTAVNPLHRDIVHLTASKLAEFANALQATGDMQRRTLPIVRQMIRLAVAEGYVDQGSLKESLRAKVFA